MTPLVIYGLGAYTHAHIHLWMKVIIRNQARAWFKNSASQFLQLLILMIWSSSQVFVIIAWVAVVFGINCASNVGRKFVIVQGAALLLFPAYIM